MNFTLGISSTFNRVRSYLGLGGSSPSTTQRALAYAWWHLRDHFIPHPHNNHQPHALTHRVLAGYSVFLILLKVLAVVAPIVLPSSSLYSSAITGDNIVSLTNQTRQNLSLGTLGTNDKLIAAAQAKAEDMLQGQYFAHISPSGRTPWSWISAAGYKYTYAGENLAVNFTSAEGVQEGWMASPTHRANIVQPKYSEMGIGIARGMFQGYDSTIVVEMFGTPATFVAAVAPVRSPTPQPAPVQVVQTPQAPEVAGESAVPAPVPVLAPVPREPIVSVPPESTVPPAVAAVPKPTTPVATQPIPVVYEATFKAVQQAASYDVQVVVTNAASVTAHFGTADVQLVRADQSSVWSGSVPFDAQQLSQGGELLSVTAFSTSGALVSRSLAYLAPSVSVQHFYTFNEGSDRFAKFFGIFTVHNLQDSVKQFYLYFVVFLAAALLLNIFIRIKVQHVSVISHTLLVIALALLLQVV